MTTSLEPRSQEWRAGRSAYQKTVALGRRKMLDWLRANPDSTYQEISDATGHHGISSIQKFIVGKKDTTGVIRYRAMTLTELNEREQKKENKYALQKW